MQSPQRITSPHDPDLAEVKSWLDRMITAVRFTELVVAILSLIARMRDLNLELLRQLTHLRRARPKSEKMKRLEGQLAFEFVGETPQGESGDDEKPKKEKQSRRGKHPGRAALPAHLPRIEQLNPVPPEQRMCPRCGREMVTVGHDVCEILEIIPAQIVVIQRKDETVACRADDTIVSAPTPAQIVERGKLGPNLIVESTADKYNEHQPIERQCRRWSRAGVDIAPQTLGRAVAAEIDMLAPIAESIAAQTRACAILATDATSLPVLDEDHPNGIRSGSIWCWVGDQRWVTFTYAAEGGSIGVKEFLGKDLVRLLQCDGTNHTTFIERLGGKRPGCMAHGRRKFVECARGGDALGWEALRIMRRLFAVERLSSMQGDTHEQRHARRQLHSTPVIAELRAWVTEQRKRVPPKSALGRALGYLHRQWHRLILFLEDGRIELTNNRVERELRALVLGRKNWLFVEGDIGGERTASILTIVATCIAQRINPRAYLHCVTRLILDGWPNAQLRDLLPDRIATLKPELQLAPRHDTVRALSSPSESVDRGAQTREQALE